MICPNRTALMALIPLVGIGAPSLLAQNQEPRRATASLISATAALAPGRVNEIGIHVVIDRGWHLYWDGYNDSGFPLTAEWSLPPGFKAGPMKWPTPTRHISPGDVLDHVFEDELTVIVPVEVPADASGTGQVTLSAKLAWLICDRVCVGENQSVTLSLPVSAPGSSPSASKNAPAFEKARAKMPRPLPKENPPATFAWSSSAVEIKVPGATELTFYPGKDCVRLTDPIKDAQSRSPRLLLAVSPHQAGQPLRLQGILEVHVQLDPSRTAYYEVDVPGIP